MSFIKRLAIFIIILAAMIISVGLFPTLAKSAPVPAKIVKLTRHLPRLV